MEEKNAEGTIGTRLRRLLAQRGQSIRDFTTASGVPYRTFQDYLADKAKPSSEQLARIALAGIDIHYVLTGRLSPRIANLQDAAIEAFGRIDLHNKPEAERNILADQSLVICLQEEAFNLVDTVIADKRAEGVQEFKTKNILNLYGEAVLVYLYAAMAMGALVADLRKHGVSTEQIMGLIRNAADARLQAMVRDKP